MELYNKHRPKRLEDMVGNVATRGVLSACLKQSDPPHCYLFHGPSGCGKTTLARIIRTELKCGDLDFRESNGATDRGIDCVRRIEDNLWTHPSSGVKVYLIDEAHMLTTEAQNAILKVLEDHPSFAYFILCTTDPDKLLPTVRGRCKALPVESLNADDLQTLLQRVLKREKIILPDDVEYQLALAADGSPRMMLMGLEGIASLSAAEQKAAVKRVTDEKKFAIDLCRALIQKKPWKVIALMLKAMKEDPERVRRAVLGYAKNVMLNNERDVQRAYVVADCFKNNLYSTGEPGLVLAAYEATHAAD